MCIPKSNHKVLITACYPPPKLIASSAPEYRPNSNELSRLAYYASNKPAKLTKVGKVLEDRAALDARSALGTGAAADKGKAGLMITLAITKNLLTECKPHLNYFIRSAQAIIEHALTAASGGPTKPRDLEISARASSTFYALATFLDPASTQVDSSFQKLLTRFAYMAVERPLGPSGDEGEKAEDVELRNRTRLIGLGALAGAVGSDALYTSSFASQASVIVPALLENMKDNRVTLDYLYSEARKASDGTPSFKEFSIKRRPMAARRPASISGHVDGEKGPSTEEVTSAAVGTLQGLMKHGDASHVQQAALSALTWLDGKSTVAPPSKTTRPQWENTEWCCWLASSLSSWTALQYRFVVLTTLVEHLVESCEGLALPKHLSLIEMSRTVLTGKLSLIGLSTSDTLNNLVGLAVRRVHKDVRDSLLPYLVSCISGLGTHIYYADQINDIADEILARITTLQMPDATPAGAAPAAALSPSATATAMRNRALISTPEQKEESIRVLLFCLIGVLSTAHQSSGEVQKAVDESAQRSQSTIEKGKAAATSTGDDTLGLTRAGTRNRVSPQVWLQTASLLACHSHAVRMTYEQALIVFLKREVNPEKLGASKALGAPSPRESVDESIGFAHALSAAIHVASLGKTLTVPPNVVLRESPLENLVHLERINGDVGRPVDLDSSSAALPVDYTGYAKILEELFDSLPITATLSTVSMILALDRDAGVRLTGQGSAITSQRRLACRMVVARALERASQIWDAPVLAQLAGNVLSQIPSFGVEIPAAAEGLTLPPEVIPFNEYAQGGESSASGSPSIDPKVIVDSLASSQKLQSATDLDSAALRRWLVRDWNVSIAVDDSFIGASPYGSDASTVSSANRSHVSGPGGAGGALGAGYTNGLRPSDAANGAAASTISLAHSGTGRADTTGVDDFRVALGTSGSKFQATGGEMGGGGVNGISYVSTSSAAGDTSFASGTGLSPDRKTSRRESRKLGQNNAAMNVLKANSGNGTGGVATLLDSMKVGVKEEESSLTPSPSNSGGTVNGLNGDGRITSIVPPYAA